MSKRSKRPKSSNAIAPDGPEPGPEFQRLKELDALVDVALQSLADAQSGYREALQDFAVLCHELWLKDRAQGSRHGQGFRHSLERAGIKPGRAYRAMKKFFPADFPARAPEPEVTSGHSSPNSEVAGKPAIGVGCSMLRPLADSPEATLSAANEVARPSPAIRFIEDAQTGKDVMECSLPVTGPEKAAIMAYLESVGPAQVQRLLLDALTQAARASQERQSLQKQQASPQRKPQNHSPKQKEEAVRKPAASAGLNGGPKTDSKTGSKPDGSQQNGSQKDGLDSNRVKNGRPATGGDFTIFEGYVRLSRLQEKLKLDGYYADLQSLANAYPPLQLKARLDWVDAHPEWCAELKGRPAQEFVNAFKRLQAA